MKRIVLALLALMAIGPATFAQISIKGRVLDSNSGVPEIGAVVQVLSTTLDGEKSDGYAVTDSLGTFAISVFNNKQADVKVGSRVIRVMNLGRKTINRPLVSVDKAIDLGDILVEDDIQAINAASVTALKTLVKINADKLVYDIESDTDAKTMTVLEMLRKVPMVNVDARDNITVNGSSSFKVYVDGCPNQALSAHPSQMFKVMSAANIKSIEVVTNPGAKYDAEGTGGILELKTKSGSNRKALEDGVYGTVTAGTNTRGGIESGVNISAQKGKFTISADIEYASDPYNGTISETVQTITATNSTLKTMGTGDQKDGMLFGSLNASYDIDSLNLITTSIGLDRFNSRSSILGGLTTMTQAGGQLWSYNSESVNKSSWNGIEASLDYQHLFKDNKEKMLTFSYQYSGSPMKSNGITTITNPIGTLIPDMKRESISNDGTYQHTAQADFTTPLVAKGSSLSSGVKFMRLSNTANDLFNGQTSKYNFFNNIGAVYTELLLALDKVTLTAGARYEHTWQKVDYDAVGKDFRTNYGSIIPNASLQFNLGPATNVSLAYNLRISRPGIEYLNPYIDRTDPTGLTYGNPDVVPERSHHLSLAYNFANPSWVVSIRLTDDLCANGITSYTFFDKADGLRHTTYGNVNKSNTLGSNIYVNWNAGSKTRLYLFADGGYSTFKSTELDLSNQGWSAGGGLDGKATFKG